MRLNWLANALFARREKKAVVLGLTDSCLSKLKTFVELYNDKHHQSEWITDDDIAEAAIMRFCNRYIKLNFEEEEMPSARPVVTPQLDLPSPPPGRRQLPNIANHYQ